jgi:hypothetical protein
VKISLSRYNELLEIPKANLKNTILNIFLEFRKGFKAYEYNF